MECIDVEENKKEEYNAVVGHPLQSFEWGEFRKKTGVKVVRRAFVKNGKIACGFTLTIHKIPKTKYTIGYLPKSESPNKETLEELKRVGKENNCIFIQLEPNILNSQLSTLNSQFLTPSFHPLFTKYTFVLDISKSEEDLLKSFHPKTRYNIRVAQKHNVTVSEDSSQAAFEQYQKLTQETTNRQRFYAHTPSYHAKMWETLRVENRELGIENLDKNKLSAHLLTAIYNPREQLSSLKSQLSTQTLTAWIVFVFHDTLYYPYGASSSENRNVMSSNLVMWEAIKFGKNLGLKHFDMWGALGENPDPKDPWYGFHKFKEGYGTTLVEFAGSFDLVISPTLYQFYKAADKARWLYLKLKKFR